MKLQHILMGSVFGFGLGMGFVALSAASDAVAPSNTFQQLELFGDALAEIRKQYVAPVDDAQLIGSAIDGMLRGLDPHSSYMSPDAYANFLTVTEGEYGGLGIEVTQQNDLVKVIAPMDGTPADRAGIEPGDYIVAIDGKTIVGLSLDKAVDAMRGKVGDEITLTIAREGFEDSFDVSLTREIIAIQPIAFRIEDNSVGYIKINTFTNKHTAEKVEEAIRELRRDIGRDMEGIVLDLRSNPGGLLDQAVAVSSLFLDGGEVVSVRPRNPKAIEREIDKDGDMTRGLPVVVLVNGGSASASEIVAGALQDRRRGLVIGTQTFGKGSVQTVVKLNGGQDGALRLTTARYYTPSGRSIQAEGIAPDILIAARPLNDRERTRREEDLPNALRNIIASETPGAAAAEPERAVEYPPEGFDVEGDFQLKRALDILRDKDAMRTALAEGSATTLP